MVFNKCWAHFDQHQLQNLRSKQPFATQPDLGYEASQAEVQVYSSGLSSLDPFTAVGSPMTTSAQCDDPPSQDKAFAITFWYEIHLGVPTLRTSTFPTEHHFKWTFLTHKTTRRNKKSEGLSTGRVKDCDGDEDPFDDVVFKQSSSRRVWLWVSFIPSPSTRFQGFSDLLGLCSSTVIFTFTTRKVLTWAACVTDWVSEVRSLG